MGDQVAVGLGMEPKQWVFGVEERVVWAWLGVVEPMVMMVVASVARCIPFEVVAAVEVLLTGSMVLMSIELFQNVSYNVMVSKVCQW